MLKNDDFQICVPRLFSWALDLRSTTFLKPLLLYPPETPRPPNATLNCPSSPLFPMCFSSCINLSTPIYSITHGGNLRVILGDSSFWPFNPLISTCFSVFPLLWPWPVNYLNSAIASFPWLWSSPIVICPSHIVRGILLKQKIIHVSSLTKTLQ